MKLTKRHRKARFHIEKGPSIEGIMVGRSRGDYLLRGARVFEDEETSNTVGEVSIPRSRVLFYQFLDS